MASDTGTSRGRRPARSADAVVDAAEELLAEHGFDGLSVRRLADRLGVSRQVVYTHFGGVDGLLDELHVRATGYLADAISGAGGVRGTADHLVEATAAYIRVARDHPHLYRLAFEAPVPDHVPSPVARRSARTSFGQNVLAADEYLHDATSTVASDPATWPSDAVDLARSTWTSAHGYVVLERVGFATPAETDRLSARAVRAMLAGWAG